MFFLVLERVFHDEPFKKPKKKDDKNDGTVEQMLAEVVTNKKKIIS
jgi:hypothetical protein